MRMACSKCACTVIALCILSLLTVPVTVGQERTGEIVGVVKDASGGVVPNVTVTVTNLVTGRAYTAKSGSDGAYVIREMEPGRYVVRFEAQGFQRYEVADVNLLVGRILKVDGALQVGSIEQTVQVTEAAPLIDTTRTTIAQNVTSEDVDRLPKGRSFQQMAALSPSVNTGEIEGGIQVNGASGAENQFNIDGVSTTSLINGKSRQDAVLEFLQEVQVKTGGMDAEYGGALGGVISAVTKSGGNDFHGDVHYYFQGDSIAAAPVKRLLLDPVTEKTVKFVQDEKNSNNRHEFGGSVGGPFIKNKMWFFAGMSPRWVRRTNDYKFSSGKEQGSIAQKQLYQAAFGKLTWDPVQRIRTNFTWLWTPTMSTGRLPAYNYEPNMVTSSLASNQINRNVGFFNPQSSYTGQADFTLTNTSLLSVKGGRFWDNYKSTGIPGFSSVTFQTSSIGLPFSIPAALQQPTGFQNTPRLINTFNDLATRTYVQADFSQYLNFGGTHNFKFGIGTSKWVNNVNIAYPGGGFVYVYWNRAFRSNATGLTQRGTYGYYEVDDFGTRGSTGANITHMYFQDQWRIHPRLTLTLGLRLENEKVPSFARSIKDPAFQFGFGDKIAPRLGASFDVFGDGKLKVFGSWGRYFDWVKYELSRGTFGGDYWRVYYRSLDTTDVFSLSGTNLPGKNLWNDVPGSFRNRRVPGFDYVAPGLKPMAQDNFNFGTEYQIAPQTVFRGSYVRTNLIRTIEDLGVLVGGDEVYYYANPGEGSATTTPPSGATKPFPTPKAKRTYDGMELSLTRRFSRGWFGSASYVYSRLYGNYPGIASSDEIRTPTTGVAAGSAQQQGGSIAREGGNANRAWDIDEVLWDSRGNLDVRGRLPTDRPHVLKLYGSKTFDWKAGSSEFGLFFYGGSGTPLTTYVNTINQTEVMVNGRGDMGRTAFFSQTDLVVGHEVKLGEVKRMRFEFNAQNLFNQKTSRHRFNSLNRGAGTPRQSSAIDLHSVDLAKGYDYRALINATSDARSGFGAYDPRYGLDDLFNPGFSGRIGLKFIF